MNICAKATNEGYSCIDGLQVPCVDIQIIAPDEELQIDIFPASW
jgi:hypothetical protein